MRIYFASKIKHYQKWLDICDLDFGITLCSWPYVVADRKGRDFDDPDEASSGWVNNLADLYEADAVIVYAEGDDEPRGTIFEAGFAFGLGKPVILVGDHPSYGSWQYHPWILHAGSILEAISIAKGIYIHARHQNSRANARTT
jgi:hypothetical protein